tara:strand:- start:117 stop:221 length:105 start_codon:yes stop_codon:yes gene_type:complete
MHAGMVPILRPPVTQSNKEMVVFGTATLIALRIE